MKLLELFNTKPKLTIEHDSSDYFSVSTKIGDTKIDFDADNGDHKGWVVTFCDPDANQKNKSVFDMTNDGQAPQVLAFVKACLEMLVDKYSPELISFSASGSTRSKVYKRMLDRFMPSIYKLQHTRGFYGDEFNLTKKHEAR